MLHGFTQTQNSWNDVCARLESSHTCVTVDLPGHGDSPDGRASLDETADRVAAVISSVRAPAVLVGYSMGARVALHVALAHPGRLAGLVLVSGTAGIDDPVERSARRDADAALADHVEKIGTESFIDEWLAQPMFATLDADAAAVADRLRNMPSGLADSLRHCGTGTQEPLWSRLAEIEMPVLVVTGDLDPKFTALGERLTAGLPSADHVRVSGSGHTVHLEAPEAFISALEDWLVRAV